jgi:hypothetical protein
MMTCQNIQATINETVYGGLQSPALAFNEGVRRHLGECLGCRRHADEVSGVAALMASLPRVSAPSDFDFKLRARIARAKAAEREQAGWFASLFGRSFTWAQAGAAMAAVALVVSLTTYQFLPGENQAGASPQVAYNEPAQRTTPAAAEAQVAPPSVGGVAVAPPASSALPVRVTRRLSAAPSEAVHRSVAPETANLVAARNTILIKGTRGNGTQVVAVPDVQEVTYGAQSVSFRSARQAASASGELAAAIF